jgi:hypothetical protein
MQDVNVKLNSGVPLKKHYQEEENSVYLQIWLKFKVETVTFKVRYLISVNKSEVYELTQSIQH